MRLLPRYILIISLVLLAAAGATIWLVDRSVRAEALHEARDKARILLDHNLATHTYFTHQLKPNLFKLIEGITDPAYFDPVWMSSTYAVRGIDQYFRKLTTDTYYYKEAAINARSPLNEATGYERDFISRINRDQDLQFEASIREIDGKPFYVVLRRGEVMEGSCLRCHDTPGRAPASMVSLYGETRSFGRNQGEVVSAISIRIPLEDAYARADRLVVFLSLGILAVLALVGLVMFQLNRQLLIRPLNRMRRQADLIADQQANLDERLPLDFPGEWNELARDFNTMAASLRESYQNLEGKVRDRTLDLETALAEVKKLSGLLPICANCKKVRDDQGYWRQIESYISKHSEATFSHGICPDCVKKLYPDLDTDPKK